MDPRAWIGHLVGYNSDSGHIYRIYNPQTRKVTRHRDVRFWEPGMEKPESIDEKLLLISGKVIDALIGKAV